MSNITKEIIKNCCEIWFKVKQLRYEISLLKEIYISSSNTDIDNWDNFSPYLNDFFNYISNGMVVLSFSYFNKYNNQIWDRYITIIDLILAFDNSKDYNTIQNYEAFFEQLCEQLQYIEFAFDPLNLI